MVVATQYIGIIFKLSPEISEANVINYYLWNQNPSNTDNSQTQDEEK